MRLCFGGRMLFVYSRGVHDMISEIVQVHLPFVPFDD